MAVKIRLKRIGAKKKPFYRIVVADARYPRDGRFIEQIGIYDPMANPAKVKIDGAKVIQWMKYGAQPTDTVRALIKSSRALEIARDAERRIDHEGSIADMAADNVLADGKPDSDDTGAKTQLSNAAGEKDISAHAGAEDISAPAGAEAISAPAGEPDGIVAAEVAAAEATTAAASAAEAEAATAATAAEATTAVAAAADAVLEPNATDAGTDDTRLDQSDEPAMDAAPDTEVPL